jgi:dipeptidyl aminopeptidase/acylaminoacyl peptidase
MTLWHCKCAFALAFLIVALGVIALAQDKRRLTADDLMSIEEMYDVAISPDGQTVAYVISRSRLSAGVVDWDWSVFMNGDDRADVWSAPLTGGSPTRITNGVLDGSSFFEPKWSPDGSHLAMLSSRGYNVQLVIWEKATGHVMRMSDRNIARDWSLLFDFGWIDEHRIAAILLPKGELPFATFENRQVGATTAREWQKARLGKESTGSVLESGVPADITSQSHREAVIFTLGEENPKLVGTGVTLQQLKISPDARYVASVRVVLRKRPEGKPVLQARTGNRVEFGLARHQLTINGVDGRSVFEKAPGVDFVVYDSFRWAKSGHRFAFLGTREGEGDNPVRLFSGEVDGTVREVPLPGLDPKPFLWLDGERLLVPAQAGQRTDVWLVSPDRAPVNLTTTMQTPPSDLHLAGRFVVGLAGGELWKLDLSSMIWANLGNALNAKVSAITTVTAAYTPSVIVEVSKNAASYYKVDLNADRAAAIAKPSSKAALVAYSSDADAAVFTSKERTGTSLSIVQKGQEPRVIVKQNGFLNEIEEGEIRPFEYLSSDGQQLVGWLLLPAHYRAGIKLPMVTYVYPHRYSREYEPGETHFNADLWLNVQLLAARGYAVMFPSIALPKPPLDIGLELTNGVLPAVDKVVEMGIADPNRVTLMGHSWGGYATYSLITQTNRFKAAIALDGFSDLLGVYNSISMLERYTSYVDRDWLLYGQAIWEPFLDDPPWKNLGVYLRNSPMTYVDRVRTPLLIIHGDMDYLPIEQGEAFFNALYRQGKRARFVRYWGEGHILSSPANVRNMWTQIYAWLDEFCDIRRDAKGELLFDGDYVKSRNGAPPLTPADFARFNEMELKTHPWVNASSESNKKVADVNLPRVYQ